MDHLGSILLISMEQYFGIAICPKDATELFQLGAKLAVIIDFAIKSNARTSFIENHRLVPLRAEIDNRQPPMCQTNLAIVGNPTSGSIGPTLEHSVTDAQQLGLLNRRSIRAIGQDGHYAAHRHVLLSPLGAFAAFLCFIA
jgi:hypothetical protein